ncbi:hypothetical protein PS896_01084 [Pseudomonas fluorescens]|uniref:Uncharacterized protein n=2 Tax=Pseudomonas fluorescens group TaxID=136843 RepID=A0A5E7HQM7_PSEFL|nr:hypothetical protein [Pseudomonas fluorescens]VVO66288.1 hypothetical protein PS896_01084 [Pseudomonas fluorescens]
MAEEVLNNNRIKFAYFLPTWRFETGSKTVLRANAKAILTSEYQNEMKGEIFCPECCVELFISPSDGKKDANGRPAYFAHSRKRRLPCGLRVKKREGLNFVDEEEAKQAIDDGLLVVVKEFMKERPVAPKLPGQEYNGPVVEDIDGELAEIPIPRHNGGKVNVPSQITTVRGLSRNFDKNYHKYYFLPGAQYAQLLSDALTDVSKADGVNEVPKLYYGKITDSYAMGEGRPWNVQMTKVEYNSANGYKDFYLKMSVQDSVEHGIDKTAVGRVLLMYGPIVESGIGLAITDLGWGEFALLPAKYDGVLYPDETIEYESTLEQMLADMTGLTLEELEQWMESESQEITDDGLVVGHVVNFRSETPAAVMNRVVGRTGEYTANVGVIDLDDE